MWDTALYVLLVETSGKWRCRRNFMGRKTLHVVPLCLWQDTCQNSCNIYICLLYRFGSFHWTVVIIWDLKDVKVLQAEQAESKQTAHHLEAAINLQVWWILGKFCDIVSLGSYKQFFTYGFDSSKGVLYGSHCIVYPLWKKNAGSGKETWRF
jgi:hypothetical protein